MFKKLFLIVITSFFYFELAAANLDVKARTAILLDYHSGEILFEKDDDRKILPESMSKILTSIIEVDCEMLFVAKNDYFIHFVKEFIEINMLNDVDVD